jgi:hypothetical protein
MQLTIAQIAPVGPTTPHAVTGFYTVECSHELPRINAKRTIKSVWLSPPILRRYNALLYRFRFVLSVTNAISGCLVSGFALYPAPVGRRIAVVTAPLMVLPITTMFLGMRYDMVVLLVRTYDFWYQVLLSLVGSITFAIDTQDARGVCSLPLFAMSVVVVLADANFKAARFFFVTSLLMGVLCAVSALVLMLGWFADGHSLLLVRVDGHALTAVAVAAHVFLVFVVIHARNAYVRRRFVGLHRSTDPEKSSTTCSGAAPPVRCVLYHCRLHWRDRAVISRLNMQQRPVTTALQRNYLKLRCHGLLGMFDARRVLLCRRAIDGGGSSLYQRQSWWHRLLRIEMLSSGVIGYAAIFVTFGAVTSGYEVNDPFVRAWALVSFTTTARVWLYFVCCVHQLDMMRILHSSFDFLFFFVQLVIAHVSLCDLCDWDARALAIGASLLWIHWSLTVDAIPPLTRRQLRLPTHGVAMMIQALFLLALVVLAADLLAWKSQRFQDRSMLDRFGWHLPIGADLANWSVGSLFLNRLTTLAASLGRSVWRLAMCETDELVVLRGVVEYDDNEKHKRQVSALQARLQLQQATASPPQCNQQDGDAADRLQLPESDSQSQVSPNTTHKLRRPEC